MANRTILKVKGKKASHKRVQAKKAAPKRALAKKIAPSHKNEWETF
ncbi:hypothetical protein L0244_40460 [bacterium]|nr:hypothetical protein [bacterium]